MSEPLFGPAGNSESFHKQYKSYKDVAQYLSGFGLTAYEYQAGRGVKIGQEAAALLGELCAATGITLSLHAPYYISLSSPEPEKRDNSLRYMLESAQAVSAMGGSRIVVHPGSCGKQSREQALALALETMARGRRHLDDHGFTDVIICPETMGKIKQLGTLDEVIALCKLDERMLPCVDFGHLNCRTFGGLQTQADFESICDDVESALGFERLKYLHCHFSKIEFTVPGGEKRHRTFADSGGYGPDFEPFAEVIARRGLAPTIICESDGTQAEDAVTMRNMYEQTKQQEGTR